MSKDLRISSVKRGPKFTFILQMHDHTEEIEAYEGEMISTALLANGKKEFRYTMSSGEPRSLFCAVGSCYDCIIEVNGQHMVRACSTMARAGMIVKVIRQ